MDSGDPFEVGCRVRILRNECCFQHENGPFNPAPVGDEFVVARVMVLMGRLKVSNMPGFWIDAGDVELVSTPTTVSLR